MNGAELVVKALEDEGVEVIFGFPGGAVLPLYDALYYSEKIKHILVRHEQCAAHAADGYARSSGKVGVCVATSGPGATNLVTGIANAYMDSIPMVAITGQVVVSAIGRDSFQEADITGITLPITKHNFLLNDVEQIVPTIKKAFHIASTGRPGPVLIDLPRDITTMEAEYRPDMELDTPGYKIPKMQGRDALEEIAEVLKQSEKPVIYAGGGILRSKAQGELLSLAEKHDIPVTTTLMGKSCFPENHGLSLGMLGMHGTVYANYAVSECDLLLGIGVRFADRVTGNISTFAQNARVVHMDIDPAEIGKNVPVDYEVVGDIREILSSLLRLAPEKKHCEWNETIDGWKDKYPLHYDNSTDIIKPQYVIEQICEVTEGRAYVATEVGQHQMWAAQYYKSLMPGSFSTSGGLGTMGFGFPASIGMQMANPDATVFNIAGDGSIQMNIQELATIAQYDLPVNIAILNNQYLGMVRQWQEIFHGRRYSQTDMSHQPDFVKLAEAYGVEALKVEKKEEVRPAIEKAVGSKKPFLMDFHVEREENVFPMVPPGGSIKKMIRG
ncbi:MAG: biosynthetic-type acetolactate synthase large subunit [Clostridia bacterium]|nr:biosynthetic-type acetolactate synthase large subunit [Clostridia bacterium]